MLFNRIKRPIAGTVLFTFLAMVLQPLSVLAQERPQSAASRRAAETGEERFSRTLNEIHEILKEVAPRAAMPHMFPRGGTGEMDLRAIGPNMRIEVERAKPMPGVDVAKKVAQLRAKAKELVSLEHHVRAGFEETEKHIKDKNLPAEILARHEEALKAYGARAAEFRELLGAVERVADAGGLPLQTALDDLGAFMARYANQRTYAPTDPNSLPWGSPKPVTREPFTRPSQFRTSKFFGEPVRVAQAGSLSGISLPSTTLPATPVPADTAPTEDAQITQPIRDLAASLNNHPVQIYNWVRNNIQFLPTYGSIQGSDMTLQTKRGNPFDTASLLIALLRAANIPARYVYGTIEVPADKAMNWVGGVTAPRAAVNLMGQGGIPAVGLAQSGQVVAARLEHVWVEAFVDYIPSRGAVNRSPDTWVPMDASFKLNQFTQGMEVKANVPFDADTFLDQVRPGAVVNDAEGWVQSINQELVRQTVVHYQTQVASYINGQKQNSTVGDVFGTRSIVQDNSPILLGTLPYKTVATGAKFQAIPPGLRHSITVKLFASDVDRASDSPAFVYTSSIGALAGKRISLSYDPATPADKGVIDDAFDSSKSSFPAYLVRVTPSLKVENAVVGAGGITSVGLNQFLDVTVTTPFYQRDASYPVTSGDLSVLTLNPAGITPELFNQRTSQHDLKQGTVSNPAEEMLYQLGLAYWGEYLAFQQIVADTQGVRFAVLPGHGLAAVLLSVQYSFGIARNATFASQSLDVRENVVAAQSRSGDAQTARNYLRAIGRIGSFLEGSVFEQAFLMPNGTAISSVAAIAIASQRNIPIYTIGNENLDIAVAALTVAGDVKARIQNAVLAGYTVTIPRDPLVVGNFNGVGYIIEDPQSGAGFYEISGGRQGGGAPGTHTVYPLPQVPANPVLGVMLSSALRDLGAKLLVDNGAIVGLAFVAPALPPNIVGTPAGTSFGRAGLGSAVALAAILLVVAGMSGELVDQKFPLRPTPLKVVKYSQRFRAVANFAEKFIRSSIPSLEFTPTFGEGVYLAPFGDPVVGIPGCPPTTAQQTQIATAYEMPQRGVPIDPTRAEAYVYFEITRDNYYEITFHPNTNTGAVELVIRSPLFPGFLFDDRTPRLYIGPLAPGIAGQDLCF